MAEDSGTLQLGSLTVFRLGFGSIHFTGRGLWGPPKDDDGAVAVLRRAVELGVDLIDTADAYGPTVGEAGAATGELQGILLGGVTPVPR